jgi:hypothetical protein
VEIAELAALVLGDAAHGTLEGMQRGGDRAVMAGLGIAIGFKDGDDGFCLYARRGRDRVSEVRLSSFSFVLVNGCWIGLNSLR